MEKYGRYEIWHNTKAGTYMPINPLQQVIEEQIKKVLPLYLGRVLYILTPSLEVTSDLASNVTTNTTVLYSFIQHLISTP